MDSDEWIELLWWLVLDVYDKKTIWPIDDAIVQARCARILHRDDYDAENHRIKLWGLSDCFEWKNLRF